VAPRTAPDIFDAAMMQQQTSPNSPAAAAASAAYPAATKQTTTPDRGAGGGALMNKKRASTSSAARAGRGGGAIVTRRFGQSVGVTTRAGGSGSVLRQPQHTSSTNTRRALDFIAVPLNQQQPSRRPHATSTSYIPNLTPIENDDIVTTTTTAAATAAAGRSGIVARRKAVALHEVLMEDDDNQEEKTDSSPPRRTIGLNADQHHHWIERNDTRGATARYEYPEIPPLDDDTMTILRNVASPARTHHNHQQQVTTRTPPTTGLAGTGGAQLLPPPPPSALSSPSARTHHNHRQQVTTPPSTVRAGAVGAQLPPPPSSALAAAPPSSSPLRPRHISFHEGSPFSSPQRAISTTTTTTMPTTTMHWKVQWKFSMAMSSDVVRNCVMNNLARHHDRRNMRLVSRDWRNTYAASEFVLVAKHGDSFPRIAHVVALGAKVRMEFFEYDASTQASRDVQSLRLAILHSVPIDLRSSKSAPPPRTLLTCNAKFSDAMEFNSRYLMKVMCNACSERGVEFVQNDGLDMLLLRIDEAEKAHIRDEEDRRRREAARRQREAAWGVSAIESVARRVKARSKHRL